MAAEVLWQRRNPAPAGTPRAGDYEVADTIASLTMGVGSLIAPFVAKKLLDPVTPGIGRGAKVLMGVAVTASAVTTVADVVRRRRAEGELPPAGALPATPSTSPTGPSSRPCPTPSSPPTAGSTACSTSPASSSPSSASSRPQATVVSVSSMGALAPVPGQAVYGASKAAVMLLTEALYTELKGSPVAVSVVFSGGVATHIAENSGAAIPG